MSDFLDLLEALLTLGLPVAVLSWLIFRWIYRRGDIDRNASNKDLSARLKEMKKTFKQDKANKPHVVYRRWMGFGSGFYGLTGLWTFGVIEISQILNVIFHPVQVIGPVFNGVFDYIVDVLINQVENFISAMLWFTYWSHDDSRFLIWIVVPWAGYWAGIKLAQREIAAPHLDRLELQVMNYYQQLRQLMMRRR